MFNVEATPEATAILKKFKEEYPQMIKFRTSIYQHPYLQVSLKNGVIEIYGFYDKKDSMEFVHVKSLTNEIINLRDEIRKEIINLRDGIRKIERARESKAPSHVPDYIKEEMEKLLSNGLRPPEETTTVTFTVQAKDIRATYIMQRGYSQEKADEISALMAKLGARDMFELIWKLSMDTDFPVTFTHTYKHP